jgi:hypothetical protein
MVFTSSFDGEFSPHPLTPPLSLSMSVSSSFDSSIYLFVVLDDFLMITAVFCGEPIYLSWARFVGLTRAVRGAVDFVAPPAFLFDVFTGVIADFE